MAYADFNRKFIDTKFKFTSDIKNEIFETLDNLKNINLEMH